MNHTWENLDRIEAWKNGEMSKEEKEKFEFDLMHNEELSKEVELYDRLSEHIDSYGDLRTRRLIRRVESKLEKEGFFKEGAIAQPVEPITEETKADVQKFKWSWYKIAASLVVLLVAGGIYLAVEKYQPRLPEMALIRMDLKHIDANLERLEAPGFGDESKGKNDSMADALKFYKEFEFSKARILLLQVLQNYPHDPLAQLYLGLSYFQDEEYAKAARYLTPLTRENDFNERDLAKWYSAWCYFMFKTAKDEQTAVVLLTELANDPASDFQEYAKGYLDILKK
ncbi:MAG: hypothetical protein K1X68_00835 [Saprospiraceae bacterium]|nr:hypothetical protein [Saprospiraceae bacterium]HMW39697.1 hypothetical protein [Saprospiraceae bacterium]HMX88840.1 hypothetical protein [Saprospiraceae bacterium]HMZ39296.1 hypothetical protein [Saprospiraceae bacterium]HNA64114.1 hypothetical protein [Saprospiraceae bacterium]